jgi:hypothetical protein
MVLDDDRLARIKAAKAVGDQRKFMKARGDSLEGYREYYQEHPLWNSDEVDFLWEKDVELLARLEARYKALKDQG